MRALEENATLTANMAQRARRNGNEMFAARFERECRTARRRAKVIKDALLQGVRSPLTQPEANAKLTG